MIRKAVKADLVYLYKIAKTARAYMRESGNANQWEEKYPDVYLPEDIERGQLYVLTDNEGVPHAFFAFAVGEDPSYRTIDGAWLNDRPYGTIHRIASDGTIKGVMRQCLEFCQRICPNIRADTHDENKTMRHLLEKYGFAQCGYVNLEKQEGDTLRIAYQHELPLIGKE